MPVPTDKHPVPNGLQCSMPPHRDVIQCVNANLGEERNCIGTVAYCPLICCNSSVDMCNTHEHMPPGRILCCCSATDDDDNSSAQDSDSYTDESTESQINVYSTSTDGYAEPQSNMYSTSTDGDAEPQSNVYAEPQSTMYSTSTDNGGYNSGESNSTESSVSDRSKY